MVPIEKWERLFKESYGVVLLDDHIRERDFSIGKDAENGFLEINCFCEKLNQTQAVIGEKEFRKYILEEGSYVRKKVSITLETELDINENDSNEEIVKIAFPKIGFEKQLREKITKIQII